MRLADVEERGRRESLARMRHDLKTPLAVILGLAEILESELSDAEQKEDVRHIISSGRQLEALIERFVALAQDATGGEVENA